MIEDNFRYLKQFLTALEDLDEEDKYRATYCLCYYWFYREFPEGATPMDKMYVKSQIKLIEGQDKFNQKQKDNSKKAGRNPDQASDEELEIEIIRLYKEGLPVKAKSLGEKFNMTDAAIRQRTPWQHREEIIQRERLREEDQKASISAFNF